MRTYASSFLANHIRLSSPTSLRSEGVPQAVRFRDQRRRVRADELTLLHAYRLERAFTAGDKRILVVNGTPVPFALARIPGAGDFRGNLAKGGTGVGVALTDRDYWICEQVAPELKRRGIVFAGLDVIGDWLTEINVTSPTCIRELDAEYGLNIAGDMFDALEAEC